MLQLLDDPLSAVDPRVGRTLFGECIGNTGLMQGEGFRGEGGAWVQGLQLCVGRGGIGCSVCPHSAYDQHNHVPSTAPAGCTRLLVTHQRQFLPACDTLVVMRGGQVACSGTYAELAAAGVPEVVVTLGETRRTVGCIGAGVGTHNKRH